MITHLEPDILECEVKWALGSITKLVEVMEFQLSYFKYWRMVLLKCCTHYVRKFGKLSSGHRTERGQFFISTLKKNNDKECSNYCTMALISHAAAAPAKSLQSCPTLCDPTDGSPPASSVPGILQARILE